MVEATKRAVKHASQKAKDSQEQSARRELLEDLFQNFHEHRVEVYKMNFIRGILFGLGSALGGTIVLAIIVWLILQIPGVSDFIQKAQSATQQVRQQ